MLKIIQAWLRPKTNNILSDILFTRQGQEELLGMAKISLPQPSQILNDLNKVIRYSESTDYKVWAQEAWSKVLDDMDKLLNPKATQEEINFYRGAISRTLSLLQVSCQARLREPGIKKQLEATAKAASPSYRRG